MVKGLLQMNTTESVKCGWRACETLIDPEAGGGSTRQYCSDGHKKKSSAARARTAKLSRAEFRKERVWKESGYRFAKMMEQCDRMAEVFGMDPARVKLDMIDAMSLRIAKYRVEMDA